MQTIYKRMWKLNDEDRFHSGSQLGLRLSSIPFLFATPIIVTPCVDFVFLHNCLSRLAPFVTYIQT